eukprot:TRINITY_DN1235_c0_g2_i1.p1 TRINITY_DN1235_c0_g2~~TRINITY_DN1235_c0_g2_i1.p1  ORF type:complete len:992 (-),score=205.31 TRINITY_DN1235_c0_g2_i1:809-3391(-)
MVGSVLFTCGAVVLTSAESAGGLPRQLVTLVQALLPSRLASRPASTWGGPSGADRNGIGEGIATRREIPASVRAHAWLALGKLCLVDHELAKRCLPLFVQELENADVAAVRNNILVALTDLCVRYTALVEGYAVRLAACLRDGCELVRRQALVLLAGLLQRDYVKWRGPLFMRFLLALVDESNTVRELAEFLFTNIISAKAPLLPYNHFVEALFVLNAAKPPTTMEITPGIPERERILFSLRGADQQMLDKRMVVYATLLRQMHPEHRMLTAVKICCEVLGGVVDGAIDVRELGNRAVIQDALAVFACKEARVATGRGGAAGGAGAGEVEDEEAGGMGGAGGAAAAAAKGRLITQLMKKNLVENTIPVLIALKRILEECHSPLQGALMACLRHLFKDFRGEVEELLAADPLLIKELLYDIQKDEMATAKAKATAAAAAAAATAAATATAAAVPADLTRRGGEERPQSSTAAAGVRAAPGTQADRIVSGEERRAEEAGEKGPGAAVQLGHPFRPVQPSGTPLRSRDFTSPVPSLHPNTLHAVEERMTSRHVGQTSVLVKTVKVHYGQLLEGDERSPSKRSGGARSLRGTPRSPWLSSPAVRAAAEVAADASARKVLRESGFLSPNRIPMSGQNRPSKENGARRQPSANRRGSDEDKANSTEDPPGRMPLANVHINAVPLRKTKGKAVLVNYEKSKGSINADTRVSGGALHVPEAHDQRPKARKKDDKSKKDARQMESSTAAMTGKGDSAQQPVRIRRAARGGQGATPFAAEEEEEEDKGLSNKEMARETIMAVAASHRPKSGAGVNAAVPSGSAEVQGQAGLVSTKTGTGVRRSRGTAATPSASGTAVSPAQQVRRKKRRT